MIFLLLALFCSEAKANPDPDFLADLDLFKLRSLTLRSEQEKLNAEHAQKLSRILQITPAITAGLGKTETRTKSDLTGKSNSVADYWRLSADWNLFRGLGDLEAWKAASLSEDAQASQIVNQELKTELDGAAVIFQWLFLQDSREAQEELLKLKKETMRIGRDRYKQGKIPLQEVSKMEVDLSLQENAVRQAEIELARNEAAYKAFFIDELKTGKWPFTEDQALSLSEGPGNFATKNLRERSESLAHSWHSVRARHWPSLDLSLSYRETPLKSPNAGIWSGTLELSLPLWGRYETASAQAAAYSSFVVAEGLAEIAVRSDELKRKFLSKKITLSQLNLKESRVNLEKSDRLYQDMLRSFQLGRLSTNDLFQEQDRKVRAHLTYSNSRQAFHESLMEACALWGLHARSCLR